MGRELKKVFTNETTEKIMQQLYISMEGFSLSELDQLTLEESKEVIKQLWNSVRMLMQAGGIMEQFEHYCTAQLALNFESKEGENTNEQND